jgi:hypothetical protein
MAKSPDARFQDCSEFLGGLETLDKIPITAPAELGVWSAPKVLPKPPPLVPKSKVPLQPTKSLEPPGNKRRLFLWGALCVVLVVIAGWVVIEMKSKDEVAAQAQRQAEEKAKAEADAEIKYQALEKAKAEAEAKYQALEKARAEEAARARAKAETKRQAEKKARAEAKAKHQTDEEVQQSRELDLEIKKLENTQKQLSNHSKALSDLLN